ncbi:DUF2867 domain-containing protein [Telluribacter sp.]|jgi:hypothetical protein|uniref:DUF2867 domain-containing protein n=1 Tax=Telluribacter sp. TaxID=1978767 RepID=UPI002E0E31DB|nr:DUF2867 domain-containing protein [Telluribacter sp.]
MKILRTILPPASVLTTTTRSYDYTDSYTGTFEDKDDTITAADACKAFFRSGPQWVGKLFILRNKIVAVFGLKTAEVPKNRQQLLDNFTCRPGEQLGLFKVYSRTDNEVILGEDDKHLDFRISLFVSPHPQDQSSKVLTLSTTVVFHNWLGRLYFLPVKPFHKLIVPAMLKGIVKQLEKEAGSKDFTTKANSYS